MPAALRQAFFDSGGAVEENLIRSAGNVGHPIRHFRLRVSQRGDVLPGQRQPGNLNRLAVRQNTVPPGLVYRAVHRRLFNVISIFVVVVSVFTRPAQRIYDTIAVLVNVCGEVVGVMTVYIPGIHTSGILINVRFRDVGVKSIGPEAFTGAHPWL